MKRSTGVPKEKEQVSLAECGQNDESWLRQAHDLVIQIAQMLEPHSRAGSLQSPILKSVDGTVSIAQQTTSIQIEKSGLESSSHDTRTSTRTVQEADPRLLRQMIRYRQMRARIFDGKFFADPAWDMLLELAASKAENVKVPVSYLCIASGVPTTTALRWIDQMTKAGLLERVRDKVDRRRSYITLSHKAAASMTQFFAELDTSIARFI